MGPGWLYGLLIAPAVALSIAVASPSAARAAYCQATETACLGGGAVDLNRREARDGVAASFGVIERGPDHQGRSCRPRHVAWSRIVELATGRITHLAVDYAFHFHNNYQYFVASVYLWHRHAVGGGGWSGWTPVQIRYGVFGFRDGDGKAAHLLPLSLPAGSRVQVKLSLYMNHRSTYHSYYYGHGYPSFGPGWLRIDKVVGYFHYCRLPAAAGNPDLPRGPLRGRPMRPLKDTPACSMLSSVCRAADRDGRCGATPTPTAARPTSAPRRRAWSISATVTPSPGTRSTAAVRNRRRRRSAAAPARPASRARRPGPSAAFRYTRIVGSGGGPTPATPARGYRPATPWRRSRAASAGARSACRRVRTAAAPIGRRRISAARRRPRLRPPSPAASRPIASTATARN